MYVSEELLCGYTNAKDTVTSFILYVIVQYLA